MKVKADKLLIISGFCLLFLSSCGIKTLEKKGFYKELSAESYAEAIRSPGINLIDVRTAAEFQKSHLNNAVHINYLSGKFKKLLREADLDPMLPTYIYCETQHRSLFAARILYRKGFRKLIDLDQGMGVYRESGFPYIADQ